MADRLTTLTERRDRLRTRVNYWRKKRKPSLRRSVMLKYLKPKLKQATDELKQYTASRTPRERACEFLLATPNTRFVYVSPTGGSARGGLQAQAAGRKAPVAATGGRTDLAMNMLAALEEMARAGVILINCLTNGQHVSGSNHYVGRAVDLDNTSPLGAARIKAIAEKHGGSRNFETSHIHLDF